MVGLRERNRRNAMRLTQRTALPLFIEHGFAQVTISEIAEAVGMAPSSIYRHFASKEAIVLWDEHDAAIDQALGAALRNRRPLDAIRHAFVGELGGRYDDDLDFQLRRVQYIYATTELHAAAVEADFADRAELTAALERVLTRPNRSAAPLLAGAAMLALDVAMDRWQKGGGVVPLGREIASAFDQLGRLPDLR